MLYNLVLFLKYIIKKEITRPTELEYENFLNAIIQKINSTYNIKLKTKTEKENIVINAYRKFKLIISHGIHDEFEGSKRLIEGTNELHSNILKFITKTYDSLECYIRQYDYLTLSDINGYICLDFLDGISNNPNIPDVLYINFINQMYESIIVETYKLIFSDNVF